MEALMKNDEPAITTYEAWIHSPHKFKAAGQGWRLTRLAWLESLLAKSNAISNSITIGRSITMGIFNTDEEAYEFVKQQAEKGDELALTALNILLIEKLYGG